MPGPLVVPGPLPRHRESLERLLRLHGACSTSMLGRWVSPASSESGLPQAGDSIGPYVLRRELGRGSFAAGLPGRAGGPGEPPGGREGLDAGDPRALAAGPGSARSHRRDHVAHGGGRRRVPVDLHAVLRRCHAGVGPGGAEGPGPAGGLGRDLLADLDGVAAPEYPGTHAARPARELLARLSYDRATAWIVARLAEALDHAFSRDVAHGDVKPSNILLSADGNPMLLDFNLARDGAGCAADPGGTLAYMAPERLRPGRRTAAPRRRLRTRAGGDRSGTSSRRPLCPGHGLAGGTHRPVAPDREGPRCPGPGRGAVADAIDGGDLCGGPRPGARSLVRDSEVAGAPAHFAGPARSWSDASIRSGRPIWSRVGAGQRPGPLADRPAAGLRRRAVLGSDRPAVAAAPSADADDRGRLPAHDRPADEGRCPERVQPELYQNAMGKLTRHWDDPKSEAYRYQPAQVLRLLKPDEPWVVEAARRVLHDYGILGAGDVFTTGAGGWRHATTSAGCRRPIARTSNSGSWSAFTAIAGTCDCARQCAR